MWIVAIRMDKLTRKRTALLVARMRTALLWIEGLAGDLDQNGVPLGPRTPYSWEDVGRMAIGCAQDALAKKRNRKALDTECGDLL